MKIPNPVIIQIKNTTDVDIIARIDYYLSKGSFLNLKPFPKLSAYKDKSEKNKYIIEEELNFKTLPVQNKIPLGYIILRLVRQSMQDFYEVEIFRRDRLPQKCRGGAFLLHLAIALCEDFILVDPSKKIVVPEVDPDGPDFMVLDESLQEEMEINKNTDFVLENEDDHRIIPYAIQADSELNLAAVENRNTNTTLQVPKRYADLKKWRVVYKKIRGWYPSLSYNMISDKLREDSSMSGYPTSPDTIAKIIVAGDKGRLKEE